MMADIKIAVVKFAENRKKKIKYAPATENCDLIALNNTFVDSSSNDDHLKTLLYNLKDIKYLIHDQDVNEDVEIEVGDELPAVCVVQANFLYHSEAPKVLSSSEVVIEVEKKQFEYDPSADTLHVAQPEDLQIEFEECKMPQMLDSVSQKSVITSKIKNKSPTKSYVGISPKKKGASPKKKVRTPTKQNKSTTIPKKKCEEKSCLASPCPLPTFSAEVNKAFQDNCIRTHYQKMIRECRDHLNIICNGTPSKADHKVFVSSMVITYPVQLADRGQPSKPYVSVMNSLFWGGGGAPPHACIVYV